jgi:hypothetical protein
MTRKRNFCDATNPAPRKRRALIVNSERNQHKHTSNHDRPVSHELLSLYYPRIVSLRQFLLSSLAPSSSTARRRRLSTYGINSQAGTKTPHLFDSTLIGVFSEPELAVQESRQRDFIAFTRSQQRSTDGTNGSTQSSRFTEVSPPFSSTRSLIPDYVSISALDVLISSGCGLCHLDALQPSKIHVSETEPSTLSWFSSSISALCTRLDRSGSLHHTGACQSASQ